MPIGPQAWRVLRFALLPLAFGACLAVALLLLHARDAHALGVGDVVDVAKPVTGALPLYDAPVAPVPSDSVPVAGDASGSTPNVAAPVADVVQPVADAVGPVVDRVAPPVAGVVEAVADVVTAGVGDVVPPVGEAGGRR